MLHFEEKGKRDFGRNRRRKRYRYFTKNITANMRRMASMKTPTIIPMLDAEKLELGGSFALGGFVGEMQVPVTGKVSLSFPQDDTACICKRSLQIIR